MLRALVITLVLVSAGCIQGEPGEDPESAGSQTASSSPAGTDGTTGTSPPSGPLTPETIDEGDDSGHQTQDFVGIVVADQEEWGELWENHTQQQSPQPERPPVDFANQVVLAVFMGERPTSGYAIEIANVSFTADTYRVQHIQTSPVPGCHVAQVITHPFHMVKVDRIEWDDEPSVDYNRHRRADCPDNNGTLVV